MPPLREKNYRAPERQAPATAATAPAFHQRAHTLEERAKLFDAAVLTAIREAGATGITFMEMRPMISMREDLTDEQHRAAISNALSRARIKGHAKALDGGKWVTA